MELTHKQKNSPKTYGLVALENAGGIFLIFYFGVRKY
jgi:hypothetical protein